MALRKKILYFFIIWLGLAVFTISAAQAANIVSITFESPTLFSELNILPGDSVTRWIKAKNISGRTADLTIKAYNISDYDGLSDRFDFKINKSANTILTGSLAAFFNAGEFPLDSLAPGETAQYDLTAVFEITTGNAYQEKTLEFDIAVFAYDENGSTDGGGISISGFSGSRSANPLPGEPARVLGEAGAPDLVIEKTADREFANPGGRVNYTIKILNRGNLEAYGVFLTDRLPEGLFYAADETTAKTWEIGDLKSGTERIIFYEAAVSFGARPGPAVNRAAASALNHDPLSAEAVVEIRPVGVLGEILIKTGFNRNEFFGLLAVLGALLFSGGYLKRRILKKYNSAGFGLIGRKFGRRRTEKFSAAELDKNITNDIIIY